MLIFFTNLSLTEFIWPYGRLFGLILSFLSNRRFVVVLDGKCSQEYSINTGVPKGSILDPATFLLDINDLPDDAICGVTLYANDTTLSFNSDQASDLWQQLELAYELESDLQDTGLAQWFVDFNVVKTQLAAFNGTNNWYY